LMSAGLMCMCGLDLRATGATSPDLTSRAHVPTLVMGPAVALALGFKIKAPLRNGAALGEPSEGRTFSLSPRRPVWEIRAWRGPMRAPPTFVAAAA
jgi:hypothetical protein